MNRDLDFNSVTLGERLREERKRLELTQARLASLGEVSRPTQYLYENAERYPSIEYLSKIANHGVDVVYVFCGVRYVSLTESRASEISIDPALLSTIIDSLDLNSAAVRKTEAILKEASDSLRVLIRDRQREAS